jgi:putative hydrolase of the HAD superfamily
VSGIRGVVFDLDDTLYPEREFVLSGFRAAAELFEIRHGFGGLFEAAGELFEKGCRGTIFNDALRFLGIEPVPRLVEALVEQYRAHRPKICLYPDGDWALTALRSTCQLAILSDGYLEVQERKLGRRGQASILPISLDQTSMILLKVAPCRDNCASNIPAPSTT